MNESVISYNNCANEEIKKGWLINSIKFNEKHPNLTKEIFDVKKILLRKNSIFRSGILNIFSYENEFEVYFYNEFLIKNSFFELIFILNNEMTKSYYNTYFKKSVLKKFSLDQFSIYSNIYNYKNENYMSNIFSCINYKHDQYYILKKNIELKKSEILKNFKNLDIPLVY